MKTRSAVCVQRSPYFHCQWQVFLPVALPRHGAVAAFRQDFGFEREDFGFERDHSVIRPIIDTPVMEEHFFQTNGSENVMNGWIFWMSGLRGFDLFTHYRRTNARRGHKNTPLIMNIM